MIQRIEREAGTPRLLAALAERVPLTDLQSLLLEVYRSRAAGIAASSLLERYSKNRFVAPSGLDPLSMLEFDRLVFRLLPVGFEAPELSPVCPLGTVAAVANLDQNCVWQGRGRVWATDESELVCGCESSEPIVCKTALWDRPRKGSRPASVH
jgi:hypothetical protein